MRCHRIRITGWTCSFRYPAFISGFQPTLPVPPVSTIYGLLSAAAGKWVAPEDVAVGYVFSSNGTAVDLEVSYELSGNLAYKRNVCRREFLYEPILYLYVLDDDVAQAVCRPVYPLVLGRSSDLVMVDGAESVELGNSVDEVPLVGTMVPQKVAGTRVLSQALPTHFTDDLPRRPLGVQPFAVVTREMRVQAGNARIDPDYGWGVYFHGKSVIRQV